MKDTCVYIIEDDQMQADLLSAILESYGYQSKAYGNPKAFLSEFSNDHHCVILSDIMMPDMTGLDLLNRMSETGYLPPLILMTAYSTVPVVKEALQGGAFDFLLKPISITDVGPLLEKAVAHEKLHRERYMKRLDIQRSISQLTAREKQIYDLLLQGLSTKEMEAKLFISPRTIETHCRNVLAKFDVSSIKDLLVKVLPLAAEESSVN
ncbi:response regulator transcription factor [Hahella sp. HN01]|uniref:response regulator transcription factor n=1 Tax=Hahella sp. HN01 TaxID=2847262 RepID=UPI001C1E94A8|nr:response regulator [Hahella sp. HN01]MBU6954895.1 response regulator [Hahella sp. HN01]